MYKKYNLSFNALLFHNVYDLHCYISVIYKAQQCFCNGDTGFKLQKKYYNSYKT